MAHLEDFFSRFFLTITWPILVHLAWPRACFDGTIKGYEMIYSKIHQTHGLPILNTIHNWDHLTSHYRLWNMSRRASNLKLLPICCHKIENEGTMLYTDTLLCWLSPILICHVILNLNFSYFVTAAGKMIWMYLVGGAAFRILCIVTWSSHGTLAFAFTIEN